MRNPQFYVSDKGPMFEPGLDGELQHAVAKFDDNLFTGYGVIV